MNVLSFARCTSLAAGSTPLTPLPCGPLFQLPGGLLRVCNGGRVIVYGQWIVAVGITPRLFLVVGSCSERLMPPALKEQVVGYLVACGADVLRLPIRFPSAWHNPARPERTYIFWLRRLIESFSISIPPSLAILRPRYVLPIGELAERACQEWKWVRVIWDSLKVENSQILAALVDLLWDTAHRWELRWRLKLRDAERFDRIFVSERRQIEQCDRVWAGLIRDYLAPHGYEMSPDTVARLL